MFSISSLSSLPLHTFPAHPKLTSGTTKEAIRRLNRMFSDELAAFRTVMVPQSDKASCSHVEYAKLSCPDTSDAEPPAGVVLALHRRRLARVVMIATQLSSEEVTACPDLTDRPFPISRWLLTMSIAPLLTCEVWAIALCTHPPLFNTRTPTMHPSLLHLPLVKFPPFRQLVSHSQRTSPGPARTTLARDRSQSSCGVRPCLLEGTLQARGTRAKDPRVSCRRSRIIAVVRKHKSLNLLL